MYTYVHMFYTDRVRVCVCVCMYTQICILIHAYTHVHMYTYMHIYTCTYITLCIESLYAPAEAFLAPSNTSKHESSSRVCLFVCTYIHTYTYVHTYMPIYTGIDISTEVDVYTHIPSRLCRYGSSSCVCMST